MSCIYSRNFDYNENLNGFDIILGAKGTQMIWKIIS